MNSRSENPNFTLERTINKIELKLTQTTEQIKAELLKMELPDELRKFIGGAFRARLKNIQKIDENGSNIEFPCLQLRHPKLQNPEEEIDLEDYKSVLSSALGEAGFSNIDMILEYKKCCMIEGGCKNCDIYPFATLEKALKEGIEEQSRKIQEVQQKLAELRGQA
jgi:hypothetical protein